VVRTALDQWKKDVELESGYKLQAVRTDNAGELLKQIENWYDSAGVILQTIVIHSLYQNGPAERGIQLTEEGIRALCKDANLPLQFWCFAAETSGYCRNRLEVPYIIAKAIGKPITPEELWTGYQPQVDYMRVWGCKAISAVDPKLLPPGTRNRKLLDRGRDAVFVGYVDKTTKQYWIYAPDMRIHMKSSNVKFYEDIPGGSIDLNLLTPIVELGLLERRPRGRPIGSKNKPKDGLPHKIASLPTNSFSTTLPESTDNQTTEPKDNPSTSGQTAQPDQDRSLEDQKERKIPIITPEDNNSGNNGTTELAPTRSPLGTDKLSQQPSRRELSPLPEAQSHKRPCEDDDDPSPLRRSKRLRDQVANHLVEIALITESIAKNANKPHNLIPIPKTYKQAVQDPIYGNDWKKAIHKELQELIANGTFREVKKPERTNIVTSKWVFAVKYTTDGAIERFKARLVARGFSQVKGIDFQETFALTIRIDSLRILLVIAALEDLEVYQFDVNNAFTKAKLREQIFMKPPAGTDIA
jgi:hypothetical protein